MKFKIILFLFLFSLKMNSQELNGLYPMVLPKPNIGFENRYFEILDKGVYELDTETPDATELIDNSELPIMVAEIKKVEIDEVATEWAEKVYHGLLAGKRCVYYDEFWEIFYKRLPDFTALHGAKEKATEFLKLFSLSEYLEYLKGMPVYRLSNQNPAIPRYNMLGKGYHPENPSDWINYDRFSLKKCIGSMSDETKSILSKKFIKPNEVQNLVTQINKDIEKLKVKQDGNEPNGHLIIKFEVDNHSYLSEAIRIHILEDFKNWLKFGVQRDIQLD